MLGPFAHYQSVLGTPHQPRAGHQGINQPRRIIRRPADPHGDILIAITADVPARRVLVRE
jgi:hypothetical protein